MGLVQDQIIKYLSDREWRFELSKEGDFIRYDISGDNGSWTTLLDVDEEQRLITITARIPVIVPVEARCRVAEYIARANFRLPFGTLAMEYDEGEVYFRTSVFAVPGGDLVEALEFGMNANAGVLDDHLPAVMSVAFSNIPPADALEEALSGKKPDRSYLYN